MSKKHAWLALGLAAILSGAAAYFWTTRRPATPRAMLSRLPARDAMILEIDFAALRRTGVLDLLAGSKTAQDPEYREFVRRTGFDYAADLDLAVAAFAPRTNYFVLKGRFDWPKLRQYAATSGGACDGDLCRMPGSAPERNISYLPLGGGLLALAVSPDGGAANDLKESGRAPAIEIPGEPVWVYLPPATLTSTAALPAGTRMFARGLEKADSCVLALGPEKQRFAAKLQVRCRTEQDAAALADSLGRTTALLRQMIARENHTPNPYDLSGVLTAGVFRREGARVYGYWPLERGFFEALLAEPAAR